MSLVFAVIAALVILIAGIMSDARFSTIFFRAGAGFVVAALSVFIITFILEAKDIAPFDKELSESVEDSKEQGPETDEKAQGTEEAATGGRSDRGEGFTPMTAENVTHLTVPEEGKGEGNA